MGVISTFGGSALDRHLFDFEAIGDAAENGGAPAPVEPGGDAGGAPEPPAEPAWTGPSQEQWEETQQALQYMASLVQPPVQQQQQQEPVQLDPLDDNFKEQLDRYLEDRFSPYSEYVQAQQVREGDARAQDILADIQSREGEFLITGSTEKARTLANTYIGQTNQQFPNDPVRAAEQALELAAKDVREWEAAVGKAYHERELNQLSTLAGAPNGLGAGNGGGAQQQFTVPPGGGLVDVARRHGAALGT